MLARRSVLVLTVMTLVLVLVGCQRSVPPGGSDSVVSVVIDQGDVVLEVGTSVELSATVVVTGGADDAVEWSASCGGVSGSGLTVEYVAPLDVSDCVVMATSVGDSGVSASVTAFVRAVPEARYEGVEPVSLETNELGRAGIVSSAGDRRFDVRVERESGVVASGAVVSYEEFGSVALVRAVDPVSRTAAVHLHDLSTVPVDSSGVVEDSSLIMVGVGIGLTLVAGAVFWHNAAVLLREVEVTLERVPTASPEDGIVEMCVTPEDLVYLLMASAAAQQQEIEALKVLGKGVVFTAVGAHDSGVKVIGALSDLGHIATANPTGLVEDVREYARSALNVPGYSGDEHLEVTFVGYRHKPAIAGGVSWSAMVFTGSGCDPDAFLAETGTVAITSNVSDIEPFGDAVVTVRVDPPADGVEVYLYQESRLDGRVTYKRRFPPEATGETGYAMFRVPVYALGGTEVRAVVPERRVSTVAELQWRSGPIQRQSPQLFNVNLIGRHAIVGEPATIYYSIGESGRLSACEVDWGEGRGWESFDCPPRGWVGYSIQAGSRKLDHTFTRTGLFRPTLRFTNEEGYTGSASLVLAVTEPHVNSPPEIVSATYDGERLDWQFRDDDVLDIHECVLWECRGLGCSAFAASPRTLWWGDRYPHLELVWYLNPCPRIGTAVANVAPDADGLVLQVSDDSVVVSALVVYGSPPPVRVTVGPSSDVLEVGASRRFEAAVSGTVDERLDWSANCGEIAGSGSSVEYTAPPSVPAGGICTIRATSRFDPEAWDEAVVTVTPDPTTPGYLGVTIVGLPSGVPAAVTVTGPGDYSRSVTSSTTLTVPPGDYVVTAQSVAAGSQAYRAMPASQEAAVSAAAATSATVTYRLGDSDVTVRVEPASARLPALGRQEFVAFVDGSSNTAVQWSLVPASGCGFVIVSGNTATYNAPDGPAECRLRATSVADEDAWDEAMVTVTTGPEVSVSPSSVVLAPEREHEFTAEVKGASDSSVTWSATCGRISGSGSTINYAAPASVPPGGVCLVRATSVADEAAWDEATVTVEPAVGFIVMSVSNVDGQPAEGVTVTLSGAGSSFSAVSGGNGVAQFVDVPAGEYDADVWLLYDGVGQHPLRDEFWGSMSVTVVADASVLPSFTRDMPYMTDGLDFPATVEVGTSVGVSTNVVNPASMMVRPRLLLDRTDCSPAGCGTTGVLGASTSGAGVSVSVTPVGTGTYRFYLALETNVGGEWRVTDQLDGFSFPFEVTDPGGAFEPAPSYISITNVSLGAASGGMRQVGFDISWDESWRGPDRPTWVEASDNWDAVWMFVKYRVDGGAWQHATLAGGGHVVPSGAVVDVPGDRVGAFIYRSTSGYGTFTANGVGLQWDYVADGVSAGASVEVVPFGIEMVYVPEGPFSLGSGGSSPGEFRAGGTANTPFVVSSQSSIVLGDGPGHLMWTEDFFTGSPSGSTAPTFPTGFAAFYVMKYQLMQEQYVDFLNTLTQQQAGNRQRTPPSGLEFRYAISGSSVGSYVTSLPFVPLGWTDISDGAAFADWAGLRPMTELEFEKAARGPLSPVANEYAWGSTSITQATGLVNVGSSLERPTPARANAAYGDAAGVQGPVRAGSFAAPGRSRRDAGAGYYGALELSGNLTEHPLTVGCGSDGTHGDGMLDARGNADVPSWYCATGYQGGAWGSDDNSLRVSDRSLAGTVFSKTFAIEGWRGARSAP